MPLVRSTRIAALTQGDLVPSARFRVRQLIPAWRTAGLDVTELASSPGAYPPPGAPARVVWGVMALADAVRRALRANAFDAVILQRELISTLPSAEGLIRRHLIVDIDDAIWLHRRGRAANYVAGRADHLVVGNDYLAEHFARHGKPVSIIPTAVDVERFRPREHPTDGPRVIGWSGTSGGYAFFMPLRDVLARLLRNHPDWRLRFISDKPPELDTLPPSQVEYLPWRPDTEAQHTAEFDIGLMPLDNSSWSLGKCSYKMLLYMACGIPAVVSDVGMNHQILRMGEVGIGARTPDEWHDALDALMRDDAARERMARQGRQLVQARFSLEAVAQQWRDVLACMPTR